MNRPCGCLSSNLSTRLKQAIEISGKGPRDIILSFLRKQESSIFKAFLDSRSPIGVGDKLRGSDGKVAFPGTPIFFLDNFLQI